MTEPHVHGPLGEGIENLHPAYFSLVMATGIVSIASNLLGMQGIAWSLFYINIFAYLVLWVLTLIRLFRYPRRMWNDLASHPVGPGYFTLVAGTCVLGVEFVNLAHNMTAAVVLWGLGGFLWAFVMYAFFTAVIVRNQKPALERGINGAWLIATVATQSVSVLGTLLAGQFPDQQETILFLTLLMYFLGSMLYLNIIVLIFYRLTFLELRPEELTPAYWINMGAVAITTLAGATLMLHSSQWSLLLELLPFLKGFTLFFWVSGTWWIPLLFILGVWRNIYRRFPLTYHPLYWSIVFPLGMYTASTYQLAKAMGLDILYVIPRYFIYVALAAWATVFLGMLHRILMVLFFAPKEVHSGPEN